jgi:hypothetical protein
MKAGSSFQIFQKHSLKDTNYKEAGNPNSLISVKGFEFVVKNIPTKNTPGPYDFTFKEEIIPNLPEKKERNLPPLIFTIRTKQEKDVTRKKTSDKYLF